MELIFISETIIEKKEGEKMAVVSVGKDPVNDKGFLAIVEAGEIACIKTFKHIKGDSVEEIEAKAAEIETETKENISKKLEKFYEEIFENKGE